MRSSRYYFFIFLIFCNIKVSMTLSVIILLIVKYSFRREHTHFLKCDFFLIRPDVVYIIIQSQSYFKNNSLTWPKIDWFIVTKWNFKSRFTNILLVFRVVPLSGVHLVTRVFNSRIITSRDLNLIEFSNLII